MYKLIFITILFYTISTPSNAYLGPGVGGGIIAATIGVIIAILAAVFGLIWFPIKRILKKRKERKHNYKQLKTHPVPVFPL